ncbi:Creatinase/aminopeptidase [Armillaria borealis]|uniref:Creatinase/aminopeptidase n=1 Tax=Armillaria borealis TaxID=47425 RepID=A0AA39ISE7_9AGAR|nr:Creatinase/aminopeptidase [Armillaria borealis]
MALRARSGEKPSWQEESFAGCSDRYMTLFHEASSPQATWKRWYLLCLGLIAACGLPLLSSRPTPCLSTLGETLTTLNTSAYIAEPGASALYYANVSSSHWHLSERPLLLIVDSSARVTVLTPKFEGTRARLLSIPSDVEWVEWTEDKVPYKQLPDIEGLFVDGKEYSPFHRRRATNGVPKGYGDCCTYKDKAAVGMQVGGRARAVKMLHFWPSDTYKHMRICIRESNARQLVARALAGVGLKDWADLTLFGEMPPSLTAAVLTAVSTPVTLPYLTASLHGYWSNVTRTIALSAFTIPDTYLQIWNFVHSAQHIVFQTAHADAVAKCVDKALRLFLGLVGYAKYFTHRLGHGVNLEVHEDPYLNGESGTIPQT